MNPRTWNWATIFGVVAAFVLLEAALRLISTPIDSTIASVSIANDSLDGWIGTVRQYHEGVATSHFSAASARMTGNPWLRGGSVVVLIGDSHVQALQVPDNETMGSVLESIARSRGVPLNVRQYGWSAVGPAQYIAVAPDVLARWHPDVVVVALNSGDFTVGSLEDAPAAKIDADTTLTLVAPPIGPQVKAAHKRWDVRIRDALLAHSVLLTEIRRRALVIRLAPRRAGSGAIAPLLPAAIVRTLSRAYGARLLLVYMPHIAVAGDTVDPVPSKLLAACVAARVVCANTGPAMDSMRRYRGAASRGFGNSAAGEGHLSKTGHAVVASVIWQMLESMPFSALHAVAKVSR